MEIKIPEFSLIVLIGASGSGKSSFAATHFQPTEVLSSDFFRGMVSNDSNNQDATGDAFEVLNIVLEKRLRNKLLTVIDATNASQKSRQQLRVLAKKYHCILIAVILDIPVALCLERNESRADRNFGSHVVRNQTRNIRKSMQHLKEEGFRVQHKLCSPEEVDAVRIVREKMHSDKKVESGPFDIIGDVHGCLSELSILLEKLNYKVEALPGAGESTEAGQIYYKVTHSAGRRLIFVGDLVDRGPDSPGAMKLAMSVVRTGAGFMVPGNHDVKLRRKLDGRNVKLTHGLAETMEQLAAESEELREDIRGFVGRLSSHLIFDEGKLVVAHAGLREEMHGRSSGEIRSFCMYGETTGETDEFGLPVRYNWAGEYRGQATVVYGHTPIPDAQWLNRTINIDTGCVFGGKLTALRYPEKELITVAAAQTYCEPIRPLEMNIPEVSDQHTQDEVLDFKQFSDRSLATTRLFYHVTLHEQNALAALEITNRYGVNPKWMIYLPPTMSPPKTSRLGDYLEHPAEAFDYYQKKGLSEVVMQHKYMGSRAIVIVCKDEETVRKRFGITGEGIGIVYTRTGRRFFKDSEMEAQLLEHVREAMTAADLWDELETDWICLDCELMPWSLMARDLLRRQYAAVATATEMHLPKVADALKKGVGRGLDLAALATRTEVRSQYANNFRKAYRHYCWASDKVEDLQLVPFHLLATEDRVHMDKPHKWHLAVLERLCDKGAPILKAVEWRTVDLDSPTSIREATAAWEAYTKKGGEGMVIKPRDFICEIGTEVAQPAIKVRGMEYLRIIYGPDYTLPKNLERLRNRALKTKRSLAVREFALGYEALHRFVERAPLGEIHQMVFTLLGIESTPLDPRL